MAHHYQSTDDKVQHRDTHDGEPVDLHHSPDATEASSGVGFNGELTEAGTGWQLLGNGYRAYNPVLMRFHSPDNLSPFGEGGVNAYAYCEGDPVNLVDPSGHSWWSRIVGSARRVVGRFRVRVGACLTATPAGGVATVSRSASRASNTSGLSASSTRGWASDPLLSTPSTSRVSSIASSYGSLSSAQPSVSLYGGRRTGIPNIRLSAEQNARLAELGSRSGASEGASSLAQNEPTFALSLPTQPPPYDHIDPPSYEFLYSSLPSYDDVAKRIRDTP